MELTRRNFLKLSAGAFVFSHWMRKNLWANSGEIPVLLYHDISDHFRDDYTISPANFAAQMEWLYSEGYQTLFFRDIDNIMHRNMNKAILITFDDGYASFMDFAFPLLQAYQFKATLNLIGQEVGTYISFGGNRPVLSWDEYRYLVKSDLIDLGCHTYHLHLKGGVLLASEESFTRDLQLFQKVIKEEVGREVNILAWPYGLYSEKTIEIAKIVGFKYLLTSNEGYFKKSSRPDEIPRLNINDQFDLISFKKYIGGDALC
jgi:peptidoglycan/xylan/chitin deacetylase (PgdA/CDA1 family)